MQGLIGHGEAAGLVQQSIRRSRAAHAYLITGPRGVGRRTFALALARTFVCAAESERRPCGLCRACRLAESGAYTDVRLVRRSAERKFLLLRPPDGSSPRDAFWDNVKWIEADAQLRPLEGREKIYIILNAEDLEPSAASRLLKTIEEPTRYVRFLLTAPDRGAVLPTIVSRCQEIRLRPVPTTEIAEGLRARGVPDGEIPDLTALADGRPGWALAALENPAFLGAYRAGVTELSEALRAERIERLLLARSLADSWPKKADSVRATLRAWLASMRSVLLTQLSVNQRAAVGGPREEALQRLATTLTGQQVRGAEVLIQQTLVDLDANVNPRLALDLFFLRLPEARDRSHAAV